MRDEQNPYKKMLKLLISSSFDYKCPSELLTWICEDFFGRGDVNELLLGLLFLALRLEVVGVPLLRQLPVGLQDLLLVCVSGGKRIIWMDGTNFGSETWFVDGRVGLVTCRPRGSCSNPSCGRFSAASGIAPDLLLFPGCRRTLSPLGSLPQLKPNTCKVNETMRPPLYITASHGTFAKKGKTAKTKHGNTEDFAAVRAFSPFSYSWFRM